MLSSTTTTTTSNKFVLFFFLLFVSLLLLLLLLYTFPWPLPIVVHSLQECLVVQRRRRIEKKHSSNFFLLSRILIFIYLFIFMKNDVDTLFWVSTSKTKFQALAVEKNKRGVKRAHGSWKLTIRPQREFVHLRLW
jgi:hypothetical protein